MRELRLVPALPESVLLRLCRSGEMSVSEGRRHRGMEGSEAPRRGAAEDRREAGMIPEENAIRALACTHTQDDWIHINPDWWRGCQAKLMANVLPWIAEGGA